MKVNASTISDQIKEGRSTEERRPELLLIMKDLSLVRYIFVPQGKRGLRANHGPMMIIDKDKKASSGSAKLMHSAINLNSLRAKGSLFQRLPFVPFV